METLFNVSPDMLMIGMLVLVVLLMTTIVLLIVQLSNTSRMKHRLKRFMTGRSGQNLEEAVVRAIEDISLLKEATEKNRKELKDQRRRLQGTYQKLGLVKYDAFQQMGGQLSFCLVLLDENNCGYIMNSVHSTEGCYSYAKEVRNGKCKMDLSKEESEAMAMAMNSNKQQ